MTDDSPEFDDSLRAATALMRIPGLGPRLLTNLLERFGSEQSILQQTREELLAVAGVGRVLAERIVTSDPEETESYLKRCADCNVRLLRRSTSAYPATLTAIEDAPPILHCRGSLLPQDDLAIGIVGSRRCTTYGLRHAERLAGAIVRAGFTVVSGLARGIDGAAHRGALRAGGRTIAVLATGVETIYPPEHTALADEVIAGGALLSESTLDAKPRRGMFPQRNRIISGLCQGVIIVEATRNSGSLHTARHAMEQGREVFAVPGPVDSLASEGCHNLIRDGVTLIRNVDDVLEQLGPLTSPVRPESDVIIHHPREMALNPQETEILNAIGTTATPVDEVLRQTRLDHSRVLSTLTVLEMRRFIRRLTGNMVVRT